MKIIIPETFMGIPIEGAMERALAEKNKPETHTDKNLPGSEGRIYVPSINAYFDEERSLHNLDWYKTHKKILGEGLGRMPTSKETWELISHAKANLSDLKLRKVYDDILKTTPKDTWHGEWQNAIFIKDGNDMYVQRVTGLDSNRELIYSGREKLEDCLMKSCFADLTPNRQGLLTREHPNQNYVQRDNIYFWRPIDKCVAWFGALSVRAIFDCDGDPSGRDSPLGVRLVHEVNAGGNAS